MRRLGEPFWWHLLDRRLILLSPIRMVLCTILALVPFMVGLPTHDELVPVGYFLPIVFGALGAVTLSEHVQWVRPRNRVMWLHRGAATAFTDVLCLGALVLTTDNRPERASMVSGALLSMAAGMLVACVAQEFAWLGASLIGFACLLQADQALILYVPTAGALIVYGVCAITLSVRGPLSYTE